MTTRSKFTWEEADVEFGIKGTEKVLALLPPAPVQTDGCGLYAVAWRNASGWSVWHMPKYNGLVTLCGLAIPSHRHTTSSYTGQMCRNCATKFMEPLI